MARPLDDGRCGDHHGEPHRDGGDVERLAIVGDGAGRDYEPDFGEPVLDMHEARQEKSEDGQGRQQMRMNSSPLDRLRRGQGRRYPAVRSKVRLGVLLVHHVARRRVPNFALLLGENQ